MNNTPSSTVSKPISYPCCQSAIHRGNRHVNGLTDTPVGHLCPVCLNAMGTWIINQGWWSDTDPVDSLAELLDSNQ